MTYAHTPNEAGVWHDLGVHLRAVAEMAATFAAPFGGIQLARRAGSLHDIGKASDAFQRYLAACAREPGRRHPTVDHKGAGALRARDTFEPLAFLVQGHHGGLPDQAQLKSKLRERDADATVQDALQQADALGLLGPDQSSSEELSCPAFVRDRCNLEFFLRMLFSALVDADGLDTERHFSPIRSTTRRGAPPIAALDARLETAQASLTGQRDDPVNRVRHEVYAACLAAAAEMPGFFRLTVPTGGGKTRSGLAFALRHALAHDLRRVIVAVPYLTITEQTADVFRDVLGDDQAVLEHHSGADRDEEPAGDQSPRATWRRLAAQNWDAPVVVTTTVQLFESLFGRSPASCRKLHRLARSVIILDEAQTLPPPLLAPILDAL